MLKGLKRRAVSYGLRRMGYRGYSIHEKVYTDIFNNGDTSWKERVKWYRRGYLLASVMRLQLRDDSFQSYVPDLPYALTYPINDTILRKMVEDKLAFRYFFEEWKAQLPEYYAFLNAGRMYRLLDWPVESDIQTLEDLIRAKGTLALKRVFGSLGKGFSVLRCRNNAISEDEKEISHFDSERFISNKANYLVTEYVEPSRYMRSLYPKTTNSVRVLILGGYGLIPTPIAAFLRIGTSKSGEVDNAFAGGLLCGVEVETGRFFSPKVYHNDQLIDSPNHPDTGDPVSGVIPNWNAVLDGLIKMFIASGFLRIAGFDVVITEEGFKVLEINGHPELRHIQVYTPLLERSDSNAWFTAMFEEKGVVVDHLTGQGSVP